MRENDEFIGQVEDYLVEFDGPTPLPGRVLDAIHAELPRTRQAKTGPGFMRMPPMLSTISARAPLGIAAAAVVVAVVLGAAFINRDNQPAVGGSVASPTPRPSQSAGPAASSDVRALANANHTSCPGITNRPLCIEPGTYQLGPPEEWPITVTFDVPENWWYFDNAAGSDGLLVQTDDIVNGSGWGVTFNTVGSVSIDPCDTTAGTFAHEAVDTASELAAAMAAWPGFEATEPAPISGQASPGVTFTFASAPQHQDCPAGGQLFTTASSASVDAYPMVNQRDRSHAVEFRIYETEQGLLLVAAMNFPETSPWEEDNGVPYDPERHVDHQVEMDAILDSIRIEAP